MYKWPTYIDFIWGINIEWKAQSSQLPNAKSEVLNSCVKPQAKCKVKIVLRKRFQLFRKAKKKKKEEEEERFSYKM